MSVDLEIIRDTIMEFKDLQKAMVSAKKENAKETYGILKDRYLSLKALLTVADVKLTEIDYINE